MAEETKPQKATVKKEAKSEPAASEKAAVKPSAPAKGAAKPDAEAGKPENRKATTDNRRDTGTGQQSASRQTPTGQGREE